MLLRFKMLFVYNKHNRAMKVMLIIKRITNYQSLFLTEFYLN